MAFVQGIGRPRSSESHHVGPGWESSEGRLKTRPGRMGYASDPRAESAAAR